MSGAGNGIQWSRSGESVFYAREGRLWRVDVDSVNGAPLEEDGAFTGHDLSGGFSLSEDGRRLVLEERRGGSNLWSFPLEHDSIRPAGLRLTRGTYFRAGARFSPDGSRIAYFTFEDESGGRSRGLSVVDAGGGPEQRVSETPGRSLAWSPDGTRLAFTGEHEESIRVFVVEVDGGAQRMVGAAEANAGYLGWCRFGEILAVKKEQDNILALDPVEGTERMLRQDSAFLFTGFPVCSPDGFEVAFLGSGRGVESGLYALDLRTGEERLVLANPLAFPHSWTPGGGIYSRDGRIPEDGGEAVALEIPLEVREMGRETSIESVSPDGSRILLLVSESSSSDLFLIEYGDKG